MKKNVCKIVLYDLHFHRHMSSISSEETYAVKHNNTMYICYIKVLKLRELKISTLMLHVIISEC